MLKDIGLCLVELASKLKLKQIFPLTLYAKEIKDQMVKFIPTFLRVEHSNIKIILVKSYVTISESDYIIF